MKKLLTLAALLLAPYAGAQTLVQALQYDADSLTYTCPLLCSNTTGTCAASGEGIPITQLVTTSGAASTTVTSVNSDAPFLGMSVGDAVLFEVVDATNTTRTGQARRRVTTWTNANSIVVDSNVVIPTTGLGFHWWRTTAATDAEAGWFPWPASGDATVFISLDQLSATGGLDYKIEARQCATGGPCTLPIVLQTDNLTGATAAESIARLAADKELVDQVRVCFKLGTADDDVITVTAATDDIDWKEYVNSYTLQAGPKDDLDFVEDAGGVPKTCVAQDIPLVAASTGATACTVIAAAMNGAACVPDNTYSCTYSTTTHKFTIARSAGAKTIDLTWLTGANTATSIGPLLGYAVADDSGAVSYVSDTATGESAEKTSTLTAGIYATGTLACAEVETQMQADATASTIDCSYSAATDAITISATGITQLMILWNSGTNNATSADQHLGFAADNTGALTYTGAAIGMDASNEIEKITVTVKR